MMLFGNLARAKKASLAASQFPIPALYLIKLV